MVKDALKISPEVHDLTSFERRSIRDLLEKASRISGMEADCTLPLVLESSNVFQDREHNMIDTYGAYVPNLGIIVLFNGRIEEALKDGSLDISPEEFRSTVLFHAFGHWFHHRYPIDPTSSGSEWNPFSFDSDRDLVEGFADIVALCMAGKNPNVIKAFNTILSPDGSSRVILDIMKVGKDQNSFGSIKDTQANNFLESFALMRRHGIKKFDVWKLVVSMQCSDRWEIAQSLANINSLGFRDLEDIENKLRILLNTDFPDDMNRFLFNRIITVLRNEKFLRKDNEFVKFLHGYYSTKMIPPSADQSLQEYRLGLIGVTEKKLGDYYAFLSGNSECFPEFNRLVKRLFSMSVDSGFVSLAERIYTDAFSNDRVLTADLDGIVAERFYSLFHEKEKDLMYNFLMRRITSERLQILIMEEESNRKRNDLYEYLKTRRYDGRSFYEKARKTLPKSSSILKDLEVKIKHCFF